MTPLPHPVRCAVRIGVLFAILLSGPSARAQGAIDWRLFAPGDELGPSYPDTVSTLSLAPGGGVVFTHQSGKISLFDGYDSQTVKGWREDRDAALAGGLVQAADRVVKDPSGVLWSVYPEGLVDFQDGVWRRHKVPDIQQFLKTPYLPLRRYNWVQPLGLGRVLFLLPTRLMEYSVTRDGVLTWKLAAQAGLGQFSDLTPARDGGLWIAASNGLARIAGHLDLLRPDSPWRNFHSPAEMQLHSFQRLFPDENGGLVGLADQGPEDHRIIFHFDGTNQWSVLEAPTNGVRWAWAGLEGSYWSATISRLYHHEEKGGWVPVPNEVMAPDRYSDAAVGSEGVFWLATSSGAYRHSPALWRHPPYWHPGASPAFAIFEDFQFRLWCLQSAALSLEEEHGWSSFPIPPGASSVVTNASAFPLADGTIVLQLDNRILQFDPSQKTFSERKAPAGARGRILGRLDPGRLCLQLLTPDSPRNSPTFVCFDGASFSPCREIPADLDLGRELRFAHTTQEGDLWLGGSSFVAVRKAGRPWKVFSDPAANAPREPASILETGEGKVWVASAEGVSQFDGQSWSPVFLPSGVRGRPVNAMARSADGRIWVASNSGLWRYLKDEWTSVSTEEGLPSSVVLSVFEDSRGHLWAGASNGVCLCHPEADPDPPRTRISKVDMDKKPPQALFFSIDRWKLTPANRLLYSYNLDSSRWQSYAPYPDHPVLDFPGLSPGDHVVFIRAMDRNWNVETLQQMAFSIPLPWYSDPRLIAISAAGLVVIVFFAFLALNRHLRLLRSYAEVERIVALRSEQLEKANRGLLQSQKMNALGALAAGVAHDFNNILSIIKGSAQIIEANLDDREKVRLRLSRILAQVNQGATIVKAMLGFSRETGQPPAFCDLNSLVEETISALGDHLLEHIQVEFDWAPSLPPVSVQKDYVQSILVNFILNARDAMDGRGRIVVRTGERKSPPPGLSPVPGPAELYLFLSVKDSGVGITPEVRARIFEPFYTTKAFSTRRGTGLGLSMAYEMAGQLEGGLQVESEPGQGSAFTLFLPVRQIPAPEARMKPGLESSHPRV